MAISIGAVTCFDIRGRPPETQEAVGAEVVPGLDGVELQTLGNRGGPFTVTAINIDTHANIMTWIGQLKALAGGAGVTIELGDGSTFANCYVGTAEGGGVIVQPKQIVDEAGVTKYYCEVAVSGYRSPN